MSSQSAYLPHLDVFNVICSVTDCDSTPARSSSATLSLKPPPTPSTPSPSPFGNLYKANIIFSKNTEKSKGYGFVIFSYVDGALKDPSQKINNCMTVTQLAVIGGLGTTATTNITAQKVFVRKVPIEISSKRLLSHFPAYGEVEEASLGFEKSSGKTKKFVFFVYKIKEGVMACLVELVKIIDRFHLFCKLVVDVKKAKPQNPASGFARDVAMHVQQ